MIEVIPVRIPQETVNDDFVLIQQWRVVDGQAVQSGQVLVEVETSKSVFEITSPADGWIRLNAMSEEEVPIGQVLCYVGSSLVVVDASLREARTPSSHSAWPTLAHAEDANALSHQHGASETQASRPLPTPSGSADDLIPTVASTTRFSRPALDLIQSHGLSQLDFAGHGLVRRADVERTLDGPQAAWTETGDITSRSTTLEAQTTPAFRSATGVPFRKEPLARSKRVETKVLSWSTVQAIRSSVTLMVPTVGRHQLQNIDPDASEQITAHLIQSCAELLRQFPLLNACCLDQHVLQYDSVNIGYAIDAGHGLKVAVLRDADRRSVISLIDERQRLIAAYLNQTLMPADLSGATFTISDLSGTGMTTFDPLISEGQAGILGIGGEFSIVAGQTAFHLVLSFDHRLVEGRVAAMFLNQLKDQVITFEQALLASHASALNVSESCCARCGTSESQAAKRNHFLVSVAGPQNRPAWICTICLQGR